MAGTPQNPSAEIFANFRTILIFVIFGSTIAAFVEYHAQASAKETYEKWSTAIDKKSQNGDYLQIAELKGLVEGYPRVTEPETEISMDLFEDKPDETEGVETAKEEAEKPVDKKKEQAKENLSNFTYVNYSWNGIYNRSVISVQMSSDEEEAKRVIYRVSPIQN